MRIRPISQACLIFLASGCLAGCDEDAPRVRLVSEVEIQALEREILAAAEANQKRTCPRPVLRGEALSGPADADAIAVVEGTDETRACLALVEERGEALEEALFLPAREAPAGMPARQQRTARPLAKRPEGVIAEVAAACRPQVERLRRAVRHTDACNPYLPGRRGPANYMTVILTARAVAVRAREQLTASEPEAAAELLLDGLRFFQDLTRGGSSMLLAMVAAAAADQLIPELEQLLNLAGPLDSELLTRIRTELGALIDSQVHPAAILEGEWLAVALLNLLAKLEPYSWTPPGGWGSEGPLDPRLTEDQVQALIEKEVIDADWRDDLALSLLSWRETTHKRLAACQPDMRPAACFAALSRSAQTNQYALPSDRWQVLARQARAGDDPRITRRAVLDVLGQELTLPPDGYFSSHGKTLFSLAALRLRAAYRQLAQRQGSCPGAEAFEAAPLSELRADPTSGRPMRIQPVGDAEFFLLPGWDAKATWPGEKSPVLHVHCHR